MAEMVDDNTIYESFTEQLSDEEVKFVGNMMTIWADAIDVLPDNQKNIQIVFSACINAIATMGPAYCRVAATTLLHHADEQDKEDGI